jgi:hypothetical protein
LGGWLSVQWGGLLYCFTTQARGLRLDEGGGEEHGDILSALIITHAILLNARPKETNSGAKVHHYYVLYGASTKVITHIHPSLKAVHLCTPPQNAP